MKTYAKRIAFLLILSLMFTSLYAQDLKNNSKFVKTYNVEVGETFDITLDSNHSTGARWHLVIDGKMGVVEMVNKKYVGNPKNQQDNKMIVGAPGKEVWKMIGKMPGTAILQFEYVRHDKVDKVKFFKVNVGIPKYDFEISVNESFVIPIAANHTTMYRWAWLNESQTKIVENTDKKYISNPNSDGMVGSGGTEHWTFEGLSPGEVVLKFVSAPRGDLNKLKSPVNSRTYRVKVKSKTPEPNPDYEIKLKSVSVNSHPPIPKGLKATSINSTIYNQSSTCKVVEADGLSFWAYSYVDNRNSFGIVAYDKKGNVVNQLEKKGARYLQDIKLNSKERTVEFIGQGGKKVTMDWDEFYKHNSPEAKLNEPCIYNIEVGDTFEIALKPGDSQLFGWYWVNESKTNEVENVRKEHIPDERNIPNIGGIHLWTFNALKPGDIELKFVFTLGPDLVQSEVGYECFVYDMTNIMDVKSCRVNIKAVKN